MNVAHANQTSTAPFATLGRRRTDNFIGPENVKNTVEGLQHQINSLTEELEKLKCLQVSKSKVAIPEPTHKVFKRLDNVQSSEHFEALILKFQEDVTAKITKNIAFEEKVNGLMTFRSAAQRPNQTDS